MELDRIFNEKGFEFFLSVDCEGTNFDRNIENNAMCLERLLDMMTSSGIYTILFITPFFAEILDRLGLINKIKSKYKVVFGLHVHPENLPEIIKDKCSFIKDDEDYLTSYNYDQQKTIITESLKYIEDKGISPIQGFRGGYFSANDDTMRVLKNFTDIKWESHNVYRKEYEVKESIIEACPVYSFNEIIELRLEDFKEDVFDTLIMDAKLKNKKMLAITHSYLLDEQDFHYKRDNITNSIFNILQIILGKIEAVECSNKINNNMLI